LSILFVLSHLLYSVSCPEHQSGDVRYILNILTLVNQTSYTLCLGLQCIWPHLFKSELFMHGKIQRYKIPRIFKLSIYCHVYL